MYKKRRFTEALKFYDRAIELSPNNATYHTNRALALSRLGRIGEAVSQCEKAINLDPKLAMPRQNLVLFLLRLGQVDNARKLEPSGSYHDHVYQVENHLNKCSNARSRDDWTTVLKEASAAMSGADWSPQIAMCKVEALLKLQRVDEAQTAQTYVPKVEPLPASFSQTRFFDMICGAYTLFCQIPNGFGSRKVRFIDLFDDAAEAAEKALELDPHNIEINFFKKNFELIQSALSYIKKEKWAEAVRDYEILSQALPYDKAIAKSLSQAQVALKLSRREVVLNMESGCDVEEVSSLKS